MAHILQSVILRIGIGLILIAGAIIHWFYIFGVLYEVTPFLITVYFHSLVVVGIVAGYGLLTNKKFGYYVSLYISVTQLLAQGYMAYIQYFNSYVSGISLMERYVEIMLAILLFIYCYYHLFYQKKTFLVK